MQEEQQQEQVLETPIIFVFGSNLDGRHGKGAALHAYRNFGAVYGQAFGLQGLSYAIPTKDKRLKPLPLSFIQRYVNDFLLFAAQNTHMVFMVTRVGCGYAGYLDYQISPMFQGCTENVVLPQEWGGKGFKESKQCTNAKSSSTASIRRGHD